MEEGWRDDVMTRTDILLFGGVVFLVFIWVRIEVAGRGWAESSGSAEVGKK